MLGRVEAEAVDPNVDALLQKRQFPLLHVGVRGIQVRKVAVLVGLRLRAGAGGVQVVVEGHAVTVRIKQSRVEQHRVTANDFMKIAEAVGQPQATPVTNRTKDGQLELWIRFTRY